MTFAFIGPTDIIVESLFPLRYDKHVQDWRWHTYMIGFSPNYLADIAARQADKRAHGIGPEGMCRA